MPHGFLEEGQYSRGVRTIGWLLVVLGILITLGFAYVAYNAAWYEDTLETGIWGAMVGIGIAFVGLVLIQLDRA